MSIRIRSNSKSPTEKIKLKYKEYLCLINDLCKKLIPYKDYFDYVYGVPRGGLIPAVIISHYFNKKLLNTDLFIEYIKKVLIVDDIMDTGKTLFKYKKFNFLIATLYKHKKCKNYPDFWVKENNCWIQFPYEKE